MLPRYHGLLRDGSMISGVLETIGDRQRQDAGRKTGADRRDHLQCIDPLLTDASATQPGYEVGERLRRQAARASEPGDRLPAALLLDQRIDDLGEAGSEPALHDPLRNRLFEGRGC